MSNAYILRFSDAMNDPWYIARYTEPKYTPEGYLIGISRPDGVWLGFGDDMYTSRLEDSAGNILFDIDDYKDDPDIIVYNGETRGYSNYLVFTGKLRSKLEHLYGFVETENTVDPDTDMPDIF